MILLWDRRIVVEQQGEMYVVQVWTNDGRVYTVADNFPTEDAALFYMWEKYL